MAKSFEVMTSKPTKSDPYIYLYNNSENKGKSWCVNGSKKDADCNVLSNCVGWACGRFNHIYNLLTGYSGIKYPKFCCNAEKFIEVAKDYDLEVGTEPKPGAIMVWQKGATLSGCDGAGHVAIVEKVVSSTEVFTSESNYGSDTPFCNKTRTKKNGTWYLGSAFKFRGFIYNPAVSSGSVTSAATKAVVIEAAISTVKNAITKPVSRNIKVDQIYIKNTKLRVRTNTAFCSTNVLGYAKVGYYNYSLTKNANGYLWYKIATNQWVAYDPSWEDVYPKLTTVTSTCGFKVGDKVRISSVATIYGTTQKFSSWVYDSVLFVREICGDRIAISTLASGDITGHVDKKYIMK